MRAAVFARGLSIAGHPALLMPAAAMLAAALRRPALLPVVAAVVTGLAAATMAWAAVQVRRGRWGHVDASATHERRPLLLAMGLVLAGIATLLPLYLIALKAGLFAGSAVLAAALLASRRLRASLHTAFALLAAGTLWTADWRLGAAGLVLAVAVGWSRLALGRHTRVEVAVGAMLGAAAGAAVVAIG